MTTPRFSVVIPTFQRRDTVVSSVHALAGQIFEGEFEVIVVVDGSSDGTAQALQSLDLPFPFKVIEQPNLGAASARNRGAEAASGEVVLFLDDDMEAHPSLLEEHERSHRAGAEVVLGNIPLHPRSPQNFLSRGVRAWADSRARQLAGPSYRLTALDVLTGQLSIRREAFNAVGGFDEGFTRDGTFGNEDLEFGVRLLNGRYRVAFNPNAVSYHKYVVGFRQHLEQWRELGRADVMLARSHPEQLQALRQARSMSAPLSVTLKRIRSLPVVGKAATGTATAAALAFAVRWPRSRFAGRLFSVARGLAYWSGVAEQGGLPRNGSLRVLSYHSIDTKPVQGDLADYSLHPAAFERQIRLLKRTGFTFVSPERALAWIEGRETLPQRSILVTFDDGYCDFAEQALPILTRHDVPAAVFVVTAHIGGANNWDAEKGAPARSLMSAEALRHLRSAAIEVGAHSRTHRSLPGLPRQEMAEEVAGSLSDLDELCLNPLKLFCYPYGALDEATEREAAGAGVRAAFTVEPGIVTAGVNPLRTPRIEILRRDGGRLRFLWKVLNGGAALRPAHWAL